MATSNERKALWFLAIVALSGSAVRMVRSTRPAASSVSATALERQLSRLDSVRDAPRSTARKTGKGPRGARAAQSRGAAASAAPPVPPALEPPSNPPPNPVGPIDLDRADAATIESLPGIGPALAARIIANRDSAGPFGAIEALCDVRGIGPSLIGKLRPMVTFTGPRRPLSDACGTASARARKRSSERGGKVP